MIFPFAVLTDFVVCCCVQLTELLQHRTSDASIARHAASAHRLDAETESRSQYVAVATVRVDTAEGGNMWPHC